MSELLALGISHKTAPVAVRERLALPAGRGDAFVRELTEHEAIHEAVVISTCNRTEVYLVGPDPVAAETAVLGMLARHAGIRPTELVDAIYSLRNCDAARHLFRVTSGLESMIVGEAEVQGQVRRAYERAMAAGTTGSLTGRLFRAALETGKRARTETGITDGRLSVSSVAVELARQAIGDLPSRHVLVIGAGETSELTAQALADQGVRTIFVANRHRDRARALARRFGGHTVSFDELPSELREADIVVASTASPHHLVERDDLDAVMRERGGRPLLVIDIAVPRDVDAECADLPGVALFDIDDLQSVVERNRSVREAEAIRVEAIVEDEIDRFARWLGSLGALPTIAALRQRGAAIAREVVAENAGRWESASPGDLERVETIARTVAGRLLHQPTAALRHAGEGRSHARMEVVRELFGLDDAGASSAAGAEDRVAEVHDLAGRARGRAGR